MRAENITYIVIHCTAGFTGADAVQNFFTRPKSQGGLGWKTGGYHRIIEEDGTIKKMYDFDTVTNGVQGFNNNSIHISYVGGLERVDGKLVKNVKGYFIAADSRTPAQKQSIEKCIIEAITWLKENKKIITQDLMILGHRDFSVDGNNNGTIESFERIKECPCFDAIPEYNGIYGATNSIKTLPKNRSNEPPS